MSQTKIFEKCKQLIDTQGFLLVYPINNKSHPQSLWSQLYPRTPMRWVWDEFADDRIGQLWQTREQLARSREVVYGKFYQGRATFFSKEVFKNLLAVKAPWDFNFPNRTSRELLDILDMDSPLSTKQLKAAAELQGRMLEPLFNKALKDLWSNLLIFGMGEIADGAFPSLAYASSRVGFEELWHEAQNIDPADAMLALTELNDFESLEKALL